VIQSNPPHLFFFLYSIARFLGGALDIYYFDIKILKEKLKHLHQEVRCFFEPHYQFGLCERYLATAFQS
jgi:hypothetical protein